MFCYDGLRCFVPTDILLRVSYFLFSQCILETKTFQYSDNHNNIVVFFDKLTVIRYLTIFEFGILIRWHLRKSNVWKVNKAMALIYQSIVQITRCLLAPHSSVFDFVGKIILKVSIYVHLLLLIFFYLKYLCIWGYITVWIGLWMALISCVYFFAQRKTKLTIKENVFWASNHLALFVLKVNGINGMNEMFICYPIPKCCFGNVFNNRIILIVWYNV